MNEQQLADLLAVHLDAELADQVPPADLPPEIAELLALGQTLTEVAPTPRPEFSLTWPERVWPGQTNGSAGRADLSGWGLPKTFFWLAVGGAAVIIGGILVVGLIWFHFFQPGAGDMATATAAPTQTQPASLPPAQTTSPAVTPTMSGTATLTTTATATVPAIPTVTSTPENTATPLVDEMIIIVTVEIEVDLQPGAGGGNAGHSDGGGDSGDRGGSSGDRDRGHGNDEDGHDEDNPGRGN